jgi:hypothetical protein
MGVHTAWARTLKDVFLRDKAVRGYHQGYQNGWECQPALTVRLPLLRRSARPTIGPQADLVAHQARNHRSPELANG